MDNESVKIDNQGSDENSDLEEMKEKLNEIKKENKNKTNLKGWNDMRNENKIVVDDYNDDKIAKIGIKD